MNKQNELLIPQGNDFFAEIELTDENGEPYLIDEGDKIIFGVKADTGNDDEFIFKKELTAADEINGKYPFTLDAESMDIQTGRYNYGVSVYTKDGKLLSAVSCCDFNVTRAVVRKGSVGYDH